MLAWTIYISFIGAALRARLGDRRRRQAEAAAPALPQP